MVNQEHPEEGGSAPSNSAPAPAFTGAARRRFTKAGAVAVGAVLTLKSQSGMAANASSCVFAGPSQAGSFNINRVADRKSVIAARFPQDTGSNTRRLAETAVGDHVEHVELQIP